MINVGEVLRQMRQTRGNNQPKPFSLVYCTADRSRGKGGQVRELKQAVLLTRQRRNSRTVDLQPLGTRDCVRVHPDLILYFNQQPVA